MFIGSYLLSWKGQNYQQIQYQNKSVNFFTENLRTSYAQFTQDFVYKNYENY